MQVRKQGPSFPFYVADFVLSFPFTVLWPCLASIAKQGQVWLVLDWKICKEYQEYRLRSSLPKHNIFS